MNVSFPEAALPPRMQSPEGLRWGTFRTADGVALRWAALSAPGAGTACLLVGGLAECIEKYFETMADLAARGFAVWCLDWRGQGGSQRPRRYPTRPQWRNFDRDADDLAVFAAAHLPDAARRLLVAHSMGGAIALLALHRTPRLFAAAALSAPMLGIPTGTIPHAAARILAAGASWLGLGAAFAPGWGPWRYDPEIAVRSLTTRDPVRAGIEQAWFLARPDLRVDGPTYGWVHAALAVTARLRQPRILGAIATPLLIGCPGGDRFVDVAATVRAATLLPDATLMRFPDARHELFSEIDAVRTAWLDAIADLARARLPASAAA